MQPRYLLIGGGGHCRSVIDSLRRANAEVLGIIDPALAKGSLLSGVPVLGNDTEALVYREKAQVLITLGSVGKGDLRRKLFEVYKSQGFKFGTLIDPTAIVSIEASIGAGTVILTRCVINTSTQVGENCILNTGAIVEHDCTIGNHAHVACGAVLCGHVEVGDSVFIGAGTVVRQVAKIGSQAIVGAGSVILKDVPPEKTVYGVH